MPTTTDTGERARVVIIGGGVIGLATAWHLAARGERDVLLLERNRLTSGTSWHAAGIVGPLRASMNLTRLAIYASELFPSLERLTGQPTGYQRTGGYWLARSAERMTELRRVAAMGELNDLHVRVIGRDEVARELPFIESADLAGALAVAEDAQVNPVDLCMAYAAGARAAGVRIREHAAVVAIEHGDGRVRAVRTADGERIRCEAIVNCAGVWAREIGALAGVAVPVQAVQHMYVVTEALADLPRPLPVLRDLDGGIYIKGDAGRLVIGGFEPHARLWDPCGPDGDTAFLELPEDWQQFEPFMEAALQRMPRLASVGIRHFMNGPEGFTPDTAQAMGEAPGLRGFFVCAGFNSIGIMSSAGAGRAMADWVLDGEAPMDLVGVDIARFDPAMSGAPYLAERMREAVANQFRLHWPYRQDDAGRDFRHTPLHDVLAAAGAVFGAPAAGIERPLWFARADEPKTLRYSYGAQAWWAPVERECRALASGVALLDLSPFGKFDLHGADALALLQRLCCGDLDIEPGRARYTQMLNRRGGIEADVTVTRLAADRFRVVGGAASRWRDLAHLRRGLRDGERVVIEDVSEDEAVIGVHGPNARTLLERLTIADVGNAALPHGAVRDLPLGAWRVRAARLGFVGELGYELYVRAAEAPAVHALLSRAGHDLGLVQAGSFCIDSCRLEKGYRHFGHDIGPDDTPLEAGLGFTVGWHKGDFTGRDALLRQRDDGPRRRLLLFAVEAGRPLLLHDEPVYRDARLAGHTTSGGLGFRTGQALCFANVQSRPGETRAETLHGDWQIALAGERHRLRPLARPPYDPDGERLRG